MTSARGRTFGLIGGLAAFPRRLAVREVSAQGGELQRGVTRRTTHVIFGRKQLGRTDAARIAARYREEIAKGRQPLSENGFLRLLGLIEAPAGSTLSRQSILDQSRLGAQDFDLLALFDAFEANLITYEDALRNADSANDLRLQIKLTSKRAKTLDLAAGTEHLQIV